jgi:hypothetical protein
MATITIEYSDAEMAVWAWYAGIYEMSVEDFVKTAVDMYTALSSREASEILDKLKAMGIDGEGETTHYNDLTWSIVEAWISEQCKRGIVKRPWAIHPNESLSHEDRQRLESVLPTITTRFDDDERWWEWARRWDMLSLEQRLGWKFYDTEAND